MTFVDQLKQLTKDKSGVKIAATNTVNFVKDRAREHASWGYNGVQLDRNNSTITENKEILKLVEEQLNAEGFTQVIVKPRCIAVSWV